MCLWPVVQARTRTPDRSARLIGEITSAPQNPQRGTRPGTDSDDPQQIHKTYCTCHGDSRVEGMPDCVRSRETTPGHGVSQRGEIRCYTWTIRSADSTVEATSTVGEGQNVITRVCWISECPMGKRRSDRNQCDRKATAKPPSFRRPRRKESIDDDADDDRRDHHALMVMMGADTDGVIASPPPLCILSSGFERLNTLAPTARTRTSLQPSSRPPHFHKHSTTTSS